MKEIESTPPEPYVWAVENEIPDAALFNAVYFFYHMQLLENEVDPPCNPYRIGMNYD